MQLCRALDDNSASDKTTISDDDVKLVLVFHKDRDSIGKILNISNVSYRNSEDKGVARIVEIQNKNKSKAEKIKFFLKDVCLN